MLVNLTPNIKEIERRKQVSKKMELEYIPQSDPSLLQEIGIYQCNFGFYFSFDEFNEKVDEFPKDLQNTYGVADNTEQIKQFYKGCIEDSVKNYVIHLTPVYQEIENKGKGGGWRWHKWGNYIGDLNPQYEHLDN